MSSGVGTGTVEQVLAEIASWKMSELAEQANRLTDVQREMETVQAAIAELQEQLEGLEVTREQLGAREEGLDLQAIERSYVGIFEVLAMQAVTMAQRAARVREAEQARLDATLESLAHSDMAEQYEAYRQFKINQEPTLASLPDGYRQVIIDHHEKVAAQVREVVGRLLEGPVSVEVEPAEVEVVYGVDAPEGKPELLIAVLPVEAEVHEKWVERVEDLQTRLAARVVQALYQTVAETGPVGAQVISGGHRGLLVVEADVVGAEGDVAAAFQRQVDAVLGAAPELKAAGVTVVSRAVPVDYLLPPEEETVTEGAHA